MKKFILILCMILTILIGGCKTNIKLCPLGWSNETHFCNEFHSYEKKDIPLKNGTLSVTKECPEGQHKGSFGCMSDDIYCFEDRGAGVHCVCDTLIYPDNHTEKRNCVCYDDLVMHFRCINLTEENIIVIYGGEK